MSNLPERTGKPEPSSFHAGQSSIRQANILFLAGASWILPVVGFAVGVYEQEQSKPAIQGNGFSSPVVFVRPPEAAAQEHLGWVCIALLSILGLALGVIAIIKGATMRTGRVAAIIGILLSGFLGVASFGAIYMPAHIRAVRQQVSHDLVGQAPPRFTLAGEDSGSVTDASLKGTVYILDFHISPDHLSKLGQVFEKHIDTELKVFAVCPVGQKADVIAYVKHNIIYRPQVLTYSEGFRTFPWIPYGDQPTVIVGRDGKVVKVIFETNAEGETDAKYDEQIEKAVSDALIVR